MSRALPTGTVTLLFTDIEGSTRLLRELGTDGYAEALADHRRLLRDAFTAAGGVEVDTQGDAFFVSFPTAAGAVTAANASQEALAPGPIAVRMGLHTGTPSVAAEGYVGIDVHRGARVAGLAHGGQVLLSAATAALVEDQPLRDLGRHRLKDFDAPAQLFQLGTRDFPALRTPGAIDLPTPATRFLGRERELFDAATLWLEREPRLLTIVGPGGTGKTRFSIELARFLADEADAGTVFVPLAPVRDAALVVPLVAAALGSSDDSADAVATRLAGKRAHVVLDNLEQLLPDAAAAVAVLLAAAPSLRILATSREPLRIAGEVEIDLPPMVEADAVTLFLERAQAIRADIHESPAVHELMHRLDGLPLAIELAAARVKLLGPDQLLERIGQRLDLLKGGRDADERHATLRATIAWSYDLLDRDEQQLFARLAVFRGGATLEDAEDVCGAHLDTLASLLDKSLVRRRTDADGQERFWMLETIREFARERLDASGEEDDLRRVQCDRLVALADRAGTRAIVHGPLPWSFDLIAPEIDNIRAVLAWALVHDPQRGLHLATLLESFWIVRDAVEGASWLQRLLERAPDAEPTLRAEALRSLGGASDILGDADLTPPYYRESLELFTGAGKEVDAAHMRFRVAANMAMRGEYEAAWPLLEACLAEARERGNPLGVCQALGFLADKAHQDGDVEKAIALALESAALAATLDWRWWEAGQYGSVATMEREIGRLEDAERHALRQLELASELGDRRHMIFAGAELAIIAAVRGDAGRAGLLWGAVEAEASSRRVGQWESGQAELEALVLRVDGPAFSAARAEGGLLSIPDAAGPGSAGS
jgi:predicted ATPase/class 3 adenylate cyclase